jgi:hypothetical protein
MSWYVKRDINTTNPSLSPDHNVQIQIEETMESMQFACDTTWVEGHQDLNDEGTEKLPWGGTT